MHFGIERVVVSRIDEHDVGGVGGIVPFDEPYASHVSSRIEVPFAIDVDGPFVQSVGLSVQHVGIVVLHVEPHVVVVSQHVVALEQHGFVGSHDAIGVSLVCSVSFRLVEFA